MSANRKGATALLVLLTAHAARAFSVGNHEAITRAAVEQFDRCLSSGTTAARGLVPVGKDGDVIIRCNIAQEKLTKKILVWHFYSPRRHLGEDARLVARLGTLLYGRGAIDTTLHQWFGRLTAEVDRAANRADAYTALGALSHYLQDAAVPAHVVPVFHPDPIFRLDSFDQYELQEAPVVVDAPSCDRLLSTPTDTFEALLEATAAHTLAAASENVKDLAQDPGSQVPGTWRLFWEAPTPDSDGWGRYGCVGNSFGDGHLRCHDATLSVPAETYRTFARDLQTHAVEATIRAIVMVQREISTDGPRTVRGCPVPASGLDEAGRHIIVVERQGCIG